MADFERMQAVVKNAKNKINVNTKRGSKKREHFSTLFAQDFQLFLDMKMTPGYTLVAKESDVMSNNVIWKKEKLLIQTYFEYSICMAEKNNIDTFSLISKVIDDKIMVAGHYSEEYCGLLSNVKLTEVRMYASPAVSQQEMFKSLKDVSASQFRLGKCDKDFSDFLFGMKRLHPAKLYKLRIINETFLRRLSDEQTGFSDDDGIAYCHGGHFIGSFSMRNFHQVKMDRIRRFRKSLIEHDKVPSLVQELVADRQQCWYRYVYLGKRCNCKFIPRTVNLEVNSGENVNLERVKVEKTECTSLVFNSTLLSGYSMSTLQYLQNLSCMWRPTVENGMFAFVNNDYGGDESQYAPI